MKGSRKRQGALPAGMLRKSQAVTTFGPGAMVDLLDSAVLIGGLDFWSYNFAEQDPVIHEPRLRESLAQAFQDAGRPLSRDKCFREPPIGDERDPSRRSGVQVLEFPQWFVCQNPRCRALERKSGLELKAQRYRHRCPGEKRAHECVPVRFLGACPSGHVQEWPWIAFVHLNSQRERCTAPSLSLQEGSTGDFSEISVDCTCGARAPLSMALAEVKLRCDGRRPWLGPEGREPDCPHNLRLLVRTASNSYFSQVVSALSLDDHAAGAPRTAVQRAVEEHRGVLGAATAATLPAFRTIEDVGRAIADFTDQEVLEAVKQLNAASTEGSKAPLRTPEFHRFADSPEEKPGDMPDDDDLFFARSVNPEGGLPKGVGKLVLASKLREVRAQIGLTRIDPATPDLQGEFDLRVSSAPLGLTTNWLPATEIWGEGVFLQLDEAAVQAWENRPAVQHRAKQLMEGHERWVDSLHLPPDKHAPPFMGIRFYMLHSLSHLLISAISLECGYAASAIRERLYCGPSKRDPTPMAAIVLSTGSSGTEGTLGGLVDQGRRIREHLRRAYDLGTLCSNDPVCAAHTPNDDPTDRFLEGAACHGCLFIAECSCERFNRYLDRALVVPTVGHGDELAFFSTRP